MLKVGQKAPDFSLPNQDDKLVALKDFKGSKVLVWFFTKASTWFVIIFNAVIGIKRCN